ncbi:MAG TPA: septum site-determining protein MinC [Syntrophothermus lipocalidus]|uniref:Probable septum site-determining protein MinC n=1 Tax=Syntrophothermus lipocalidus (strain DSM 12680 / TGB-C1) TaxID=643648 RepID=D7CL90_SYNLT|nr:septum site-determining protein MinC [Syntrophothermus lipocalidus]ADI01475.1 septum site-determining protein MinC [Syntrophothermus lipocalidus DSM 12680]HHV76777.1 septum site-determining protein MinC [Syntrophothermus lipocalidus]
MSRSEVLVGGNQRGIVIRLDPSEDFLSLKKHLKEKVESIDEALRGSPVELDIGQKILTRNELRELGEILAQKGLHLKGILGRYTQHESTDEATAEKKSPLFKVLTKEKEIAFSRETVLIRQNLRSGQRIKHSGNIVLMGDVNPGAEVIAGGSIIVIGSLRGMAHAGVGGDTEAVVAALKLQPTQLRIADHITRSPDGAGEMWSEEPEIAHIKDGKVVIEKFKI